MWCLSMGFIKNHLLATALLGVVASESWANVPPSISSIVPESQEVLLGQTVSVSAQVSDPDGDALSFFWSASGGTITGSGLFVSWTAPLLGGTYGITLTVTDASGAADTRSASLWAVPARYLFSIPAPGRPARVAADSDGNIFAVIPERAEVRLFSGTGAYQGVIQELWKPMGIAADKGRIYVGDEGFHEVRIFDYSGGLVMSMGRDMVSRPVGIAVDPVSGLVYVSDSTEGMVRVFSSSTGDLLFSFGRPAEGDAMLLYPTGLAVDRARGKLLVADFDASSIKAYDLSDGQFRWIFGPYTAPMYADMAFGNPIPPQPSLSDAVPAKIGGLALNRQGWIFAAETVLSVIETFDADGNFAAVLGGEGDGPGQLKTPTDAVVDGQGRLVVADGGNSRIQVYGLAEYFQRNPSVAPSPMVPPPSLVAPGQGRRTAGAVGRTIGCSCSLGAADTGNIPVNALPWASLFVILSRYRGREKRRGRT